MATPRKITSKRILIFSAAIAAVLLAVFYYRVKTGQSVLLGGESTYTVARQDMTISVMEPGSIKARNAVTIRSAVEGRTTIVSIIPEGTVLTEADVASGKIIMELDTSSLKEDLSQRQISYNTALAEQTDAKESLLIQKNQNESNVQQGRLMVKFALMDLQKYTGQVVADLLLKKHEKQPVDSNDFITLTQDPNRLGGEGMQKLRQLQSDIDLAVEEFRRAQSDLGWTEKLYSNKYVSRSELEADQLKAKRTEITTEQAKTALDLFIQYEFPKYSHKFFSDYIEAERQLERAIATARAQLAQAEAKLSNAESKFELEKERLDRLKRQIDASVVRAPSAGMVVYATQFSRGSRSRTSIEVGRDVYEREEIMSIPNTSEMAVDAKIHETNIDKVMLGQFARIIVDAVPDQVFYGQVLKIAPLPDPVAFMANPDLKVYTTEVSLAGGSMLRPGMSAKVEIVIALLKDVLVVPVQCIANRGGKKICYVQTNSSQAREVKTGPYNDKFVQILEGLKEGEKVLLNPPRIFDQPQERPIPEGAIPESSEATSQSDGSAPNGQAGSPQAGSELRSEGQSPAQGQPQADGQTEHPRRRRPEGQTERPRRPQTDKAEGGDDKPAREPQS